MLVIDGCRGEGGGQVLRTGLSLSAALGVPVRVENVRGGRGKPGLLRQHLTALRAAAEVCGGTVRGDELGSREVELEPGAPRAGEYRFAVGSAGSAMLVLQTVLPPLLRADGESEVVVEGGTHNPWAPPFEALERSFAPLVARAGAGLELALERPGFYPAGGGRVVARIRPAAAPRWLELLERGPELARSAEALVAHLPASIGERELDALAARLPWLAGRGAVRALDGCACPGNVVHVVLEFEAVTEVLTAFGERGVRAEGLVKKLGARVARYLAGGAPVGEHLADQLVLPLALLAGGRYRAIGLSLHARTNVDVVNAFLPGAVGVEETGGGAIVTVRPAPRS